MYTMEFDQSEDGSCFKKNLRVWLRLVTCSLIHNSLRLILNLPWMMKWFPSRQTSS